MHRIILALLLAGLIGGPVASLIAQEAVEEAAEKVAQKVAEKAAAKEDIKAKIKAERPAQWLGPTKVHFIIFVIDIDNIDGAAQNFAANVFIQLRWHDPRLADPGSSPRQIPMDEVWNPRILLANQQGLVRPSLPEVVEVSGDGTVIYRQRYVALMSQPLMLNEFPLDQHTFTIQFVAVGHRPDSLEFVPDTIVSKEEIVGGGIADRLSLPDWKIVSYQAVGRPYTPIEAIRAAGFVFEFVAKRQFLYYLWQVIVPLAVIVAMSWAAFWIDPRQAGAQIGVASSAILTLIAYRFVLASLLPRLPYMTRMDYLTLGSTLLVFLALTQVILTSTLARKNLVKTARWIDRVSRVAFPSAFVLLFVWSLFL